MKLALGSAQLGLRYGISNKVGEVAPTEASAILNLASCMGINTLDTAVTYGESEMRLGKIGLDGWRVVTKLPEIPEKCDDVYEWVWKEVCSSLARLKINRLYGLLLHRPAQLLGFRGEDLYNVLVELKRAGLVQKIGVSIYDPKELIYLLKNFDIDLLQSPFSLLDNRLVASGMLREIKSRKIELHVRSIFLQGLLLMSKSECMQRFSRWEPLWDCWSRWLVEHELTALEACVRYALIHPEIDRVVIGVENRQQLREILSAVEGHIPDLPKHFRTNDIDLLNPSLWQKLI